jgi:hypothetical protein
MRSPPVSTVSHAEPSARTSATTSPNRHTSAQNRAGSRSDHAWRVALSVTPAASPPNGCTRSRMNRVTFACSTCSAVGAQRGGIIVAI